MPDFLLRNVDTDILESLKSRAVVNGRSLQAEIMLILQRAAKLGPVDARKLSAKLRKSIKRKNQIDSVELLREDRRR